MSDFKRQLINAKISIISILRFKRKTGRVPGSSEVEFRLILG